MKTFDWELFKNKRNHIAVRCKTESEAREFCNLMHQHGMKWCNGASYLNKTLWETYGTDTCYGNHGTHGTIDAYENSPFNTYVIVDWSYYTDDFRVETVEEFLMRTGRKIQSYE